MILKDLLVVLLLFYVIFMAKVQAEVITLSVPVISESPKQHLFYHDLLTQAIQEAGHIPELELSEAYQNNVLGSFKRGVFSIYWMVESEERNAMYIPIEVGLTNKLIGKRILFIKKGDQHIYDNVKSLDDFRKLNQVAGMGSNWFDVKVWHANKLHYKEQHGNWSVIFKKIAAGRDFNYISRGVNEIIADSIEHPDLDIEKRLVLIYDRDFRFYLSRKGAKAGFEYKDILSDAMRKAKASGLIERLVRQYWANDFEQVDYDNRIKLPLITPK